MGGEPIDPKVLLGLLFYGYATGVFSSRKIEKATYESIPFRFIAGGLHPDHDTIAHFQKTFLVELKALFVQVLLVAQEAGALNLGNISLDGSKLNDRPPLVLEAEYVGNGAPFPITVIGVHGRSLSGIEASVSYG